MPCPILVMLPTLVPLMLSSECFCRAADSKQGRIIIPRDILVIPIYFLFTSLDYTSYSIVMVAPAMPLHPGSSFHFGLLPLWAS